VTVRLETRTVFRCKCIRCGHEWDALKKPFRCAKCKYRSWNGEDNRFRDPFDFTDNHYNAAKGRVPASSRFETGTEAPSLPPLKVLRETLAQARTIIHRLILDNPCDHSKDLCVCDEKRTLASIDRQIKKMDKLFAVEAR